VDVSCAFATALDTPEHVAVAERLGYARAWCYDSPALYPDVWMILSQAAERTSRIGLGPGVLIPFLRHPMVNAAAIATLVHQAPGRVAVAVGSGFTGRLTMGQRPMRWTDVRAYVAALQGLLRGEDVEWEGKTIRMLHPDGFAPERPIDVPFLIGAEGPKGLAVANELGDGVFSAGPPLDGGPRWKAALRFGTVLDEDEDVQSERVRRAAGAALAVVYHATYERGGAATVDAFPGGREWRESVESAGDGVRHIEIHKGHLIHLNEHDEAAWAAGSWQALRQLSLSGTASEIRERLDALAAQGVTEVAYQPHGFGPDGDIPQELERFARAAGLS
jgi:5,10-methylenetetrahydromethanopterin reductase